MEVSDLKQISKRYEHIMRKLFPNNTSNRNGCDPYLMIRLIDTEMSILNNKDFQKHFGAPSHSKQIEKMQHNISIGIERLKKEIFNDDDLIELLRIEDRLDYATSFRPIMKILEDLSLFIDTKETLY